MYRNIASFIQGTLLLFFAAASLSACSDDSEAKRNFRTQARDILGEYTSKMSQSFANGGQVNKIRGAMGVMNAVSPYGGIYMYANPNVDIENCVRLVQQIPRQAEYFKMAMATTARCVTRSIARRNPLFTQGAQQLPWGTQDMWGYDMNANQLGQFNANPNYAYAGIFSPFMNNGVIQGDLRLPGSAY